MPANYTAVDHLLDIETEIYARIYGRASFDAARNSIGDALPMESAGLGMKGGWSRNDPGAIERDSDHDGIPDALDGHFGQGAVDPLGHT